MNNHHTTNAFKLDSTPQPARRSDRRLNLNELDLRRLDSPQWYQASGEVFEYDDFETAEMFVCESCSKPHYNKVVPLCRDCYETAEKSKP